MHGENKLNLKDNLEEKYVAFLDVMGFSNLVNRGNIDNLESYFTKITEILDTLKHEKANIQSFLISDSIILIAPNTKTDLRQLFSAIRRIQCTLLYRKILLRGAVSFGQIYFNNEKNIIVGKGFIKAYLLEGEAIFPRVIIDPAIIKNIGKDKTEFSLAFNGSTLYNFEERVIYSRTTLTQISEDAIFVDYACKVIRRQNISDSLKKVYELIAENMYGEQKLFSKYVWLRDYFLESLRLAHYHISDEDNNAKNYKKKVKDWIGKFERL